MSVITPRTGEGNNQLTVDYNRQKLFIGNNSFEKMTYTNNSGSEITLSVGKVMGRKTLAAGSATPDGGNTGNGTVTLLALSALGGPPIVGTYTLVCNAITPGGIAVSAVTPDGGNTGNGTVTLLAVSALGGPPVIGAYTLVCNAIAPGGISAGAVTAGGGNTGNGVPGTATPGTQAKAGTYTLTCIDASVSGSEIFEVIDPDGVKLEDLTVAVAYTNNHFALTIADGGTDFIVGDTFTILMSTVHAGIFTLTDPNSNIIANDIALPGTAGGTIAFEGGGISFTITDGSTDFAVNDAFSFELTSVNNGIFTLTDPNGNIVANDIALPGTAGGTIAFEGGGLSFTITDGSTDFVVNDAFDLTVTALNLAYELKSGSVDGSQIPVGVLSDQYIIANGASATVYVCTGGKVDEDYLVFDGTDDLDTVIEGRTLRDRLKADTVGIILETGTNMDAYDNA